MKKNRQIFINLPVKNLEKSIGFFTELGFKFNSLFTDQNAACMIISENIFAMLLVEKFFKSFTGKKICNAGKQTEVILAITADSREQVNAIVKKALAAGGRKSNDPVDHGWIYSWSFQDIDNHLWEIIYMDQDETVSRKA